MIDTQTNKPHYPGTTLSLKNALRSLSEELGCTWHCSGNNAFGALPPLQLLQLEGTKIEIPRNSCKLVTIVGSVRFEANESSESTRTANGRGSKRDSLDLPKKLDRTKSL
ncbi:hypothetical protein K439DRAFT_982135 [Ramaria rubella]|nr:hypothetical protein K439DRAFT_982135 [Ramaria rubella]